MKHQPGQYEIRIHKNMSKQQHQQALSPEKYIRTRARALPIGTCYINSNWLDSGSAIVFVSRRHINAHVTYAAYNVDLYCLGMKESIWAFNQDPLDFKNFMEQQQKENPQGLHLIKASYGLVHNIIYGAIEYAGEFGFLPHKSFETSRYILEEDDDHVKLIELTFGFNGKPLYISSPEQPAEGNRVLAQLEKNPGRGKYEYITEADAPEFFENADKMEQEAANYHDPEVKLGIIKEFIARAESTAESLFEKTDKLVEMVEITDAVFYEYIVNEAELNKAFETIKELFDFRITDEPFSDEMLLWKNPATADLPEIRRQAEKLLFMLKEVRVTDGLRQSKEMMDKYPGFPVFIYLNMKFLEQKEGIEKQLAKLEKYILQYPDYLPLAYLYAVSALLNNPENTSEQIDESLHLKNFYPERKAFCKEEALLYVYLLSINYGSSGEFALNEALIMYFGNNFPGILPESQILTVKLVKIPFVLDWCKKWMEEQDQSTDK